jgi:hypothetical protein
MTRDGTPFRPSERAERRLAGAMSCFRPDGGGPEACIGYSPYHRPCIVDNLKGALVNRGVVRTRADGLGLRFELRPWLRSRRRAGAG